MNLLFSLILAVAGFLPAYGIESTGDNLGSHISIRNVEMSGFWLSNDGDDEGIFPATDGNIGMGSNSPNAHLHIEGTNAGLNFETHITSKPRIGFYKAGDSEFAAIAGSQTVAGQGYLFLITSDTTRMTITSDGIIGVGHSNPTAINSRTNTLFVGDGTSELVMDAGSLVPDTWSLYTNNPTGQESALQVSSAATASVMTFRGSGNVGVSTSNPQCLFTVGNGTLCVTSDGKIGIGGVISPDYILHVKNAVAVIQAEDTDGAAGIKMYNSNTAAINTNLGLFDFVGKDTNGNSNVYAREIGRSGSSVTDGAEEGELYFQTMTNGSLTTKMVINENGNVGIGTTTPAAQFVVGNGTMVVTTVGNVGVGTTSPVALLGVDGDGYFSGEVKASTFNTHGSAYQVDDTTVIDGSRNIYAGAILRMTATADCSAATPGAAGEMCMESTNESQTLWISTSETTFFPIENHGTSGCEGRFAMALSSTNADWTTISVATTFVTMNGTFSSTPTYNHDFTFSGATATYTGSSVHWFKVILTASLQMTSKDNDTAFAIYKNNALTPFGYKSVRIAKENTGWPGTAQDIVSLSNGDTISVRVKNKTNTDNILCKEVTLTIEQMD